jgi:hypothetical protein
MTNLWTFGYKVGSAPATRGVVEALDEAEAFAVAQAWCRSQGSAVRGPFDRVRPFVLAGPEILGKVKPAVEEPVAPELPSAVEATTGSLMSRVFGR